MAPAATDQLQRLVDQADGDVLLLHDAASAAPLADVDGDRLLRAGGAGDLPEPRAWAAVLVAVADAAALRRLASVLPKVGGTRVIACWLAEGEQPALLVPRPEWPPLTTCNARRLPSGEWLTVLRFARRLQAGGPIAELARSAAPGGTRGHAGLVVATADPFQVLGSAGAYDEPDDHFPPDVVLGSGAPTYEQPVTGRQPVVVTDPLLLGGPLDEGLLNPRGFLAEASADVVPLDSLGLDPVRGATAALVAGLREHRGVRVGWPADPRAVAGLAMAGVPLVGGPVPADARAALGERLADLLTTEVDLDDPLRRQEHSVRLRRTALLEHSSLGWRNRLAAAAGTPFRAFPTCSVLLVTRRPERLEFAVRQVARQRIDLELVVVGHGFEPDAGLVHAQVPGAVVLSADAGELYGDALNRAAGAASGDLLAKMDDDDWYGPDFLGDLQLARHYSGADIVGTPAEFVYLEEVDRTVQRTERSELTGGFVAGGTMLFSRDLLASVGGFRPVVRSVDLQLLAGARAAGGQVYRSHGLGYVLRRTASGHTWDAGTDYFLEPDRVAEQWAGFRPSALVEPDPER
ncbi:hypothetical protein ASC77_07460 [Nocardioides sp. Root1257]|uniref:glycosyltransferase n=1 Tax=unclassified Nocardioides TaxID=2615069 RepID=UPI0006FCF005|nr:MULTISPECIES: glycosyltransferase [unclassified Nocardioides]KQW48575.1 hypothetical protein ASC77_07460 [Nocardioides sp. Root1257]KRC47751.1 hypothetical protein ASE24_07465 [Nocardioides sp. Root224]